jgi:hypothetical protein
MVAHTAASAAMPGLAHTAASVAMRGPKRVMIRTMKTRSMNCWTKAGCRPANMHLARKKINEFLDQHP